MVEHRRTPDFKIAFAIGLGTMIAAGLFSLSGTAVAAIGSRASRRPRGPANDASGATTAESQSRDRRFQ